MLLKIILISIIGILVINMIKQYKSEYAILVAIAVVICIFWLIADEIMSLKNIAGNMIGELDTDKQLYSDIIKLICIEYARKFGSDICTDFGYKILADKIDFSARIAAAFVLIPKIYELYVDIIKLL